MTNGTVLGAAAEPAVHLLRVHRAARIMGCSCRTVRRWIRQGKLRAYRLGRRPWGVHSRDVEAVRVLRRWSC